MNNWKVNAIEVLTQKYNITEARASKWVDKYYTACFDALCKGYSISNKVQQDAGHIPIALRELRSTLRINHKGTKVDLLKDLDLIEIISLGSNLTGKRTMAMTKIPLNILLSSDDKESVFEHWYSDFTKDLQDENYDVVQIDPKSLNNYIRNTKEFIKTRTNTNEINKLYQLLYKAESLFIVQEMLDFIPHIINESDYGRLYYKSLNLVNCPVVVREAALGKCTKVDICNSVFQWRYNVVKDLYPDTKLPETLDYTEFKVKHRERLVDHVFGANNKMDRKFKESLIKRAITAIGFGAKAKDTSFWGAPALRDVFTPLGCSVVQKDTLARFLDDPFIKRFVQEQEMMSGLIYNAVKDDIKADWKLKMLLSDGRGLSKAKVLAYLYQHAERRTMQPVYDMLGDKVVLKVHDGFYAKGLTANDKVEMKIHFNNENVQIDIDELSQYNYNDYEHKAEVQDHKALIAEQSRLAETYEPKHVTLAANSTF